MLLKSDDSLYRIDAKWLGPKGNTLPFAARYSAWAMAFAGVFVFLAVFRKAGLPFSPFTAVLCIALSVGVTALVHRRIDAERPVRAVAADFWHEVKTPRPPTAVHVTLTVPSRRRLPALGRGRP